MRCACQLSSFVLGCALAIPAAGVEFVPGWDARMVWDSNVLGGGSNSESGFAVRGGPDLHLRRPLGDLTFDLRYQPRYQYYFVDVSGANSLDHFGSARVDWQATPLTLLSLNSDFAVARNLSLLAADPTLAQGDFEVTDQKVFRSSNTLLATRQLSPRLQLQAIGTGAIYEYEEDTEADGRSFSGVLQLLRALSPRTRTGFGGSITRQNFDKTPLTAEGRGTTFYQGFGIFTHQLGPRTSFNLQAGPAWAVPDQFGGAPQQVPRFGTVEAQRGIFLGRALVAASTCPSLGDGTFALSDSCQGNPLSPLIQQNQAAQVELVDREDVNGSLTMFGRVSLDRHWRTFTASLSYQRSASAAGGFGTSTNLDTVSAQVVWRPKEYWTVSSFASWEHQVSTSEVPVPELVLEPATAFVEVVRFQGQEIGRVVDSCAVIGPGCRAVPDAGQAVALRTRELTDSAIDTQTYRLNLQAKRRIDRHLALVASTSWRRQRAQGDFQQDQSNDELRFELGMIWNWDPIHLD